MVTALESVTERVTREIGVLLLACAFRTIVVAHLSNYNIQI